MIRVNLMRNRVADAASGGPTGAPTSVRNEETRDAIVKIVSIVIFTGALMVYESQNLNTMNGELNRTQMLANELETQAQAKAAEVEGIKDIAKQALELEDKLKVLKLLSKLRLREVKTLDFMQSSIPEKVWLKSLKYESNKDVKNFAEQGRYQFDGNSASTDDLSEFAKRLEDSAYLNEVIVIKNQENVGPGRAGVYRDFQFTAEVEVKN